MLALGAVIRGRSKPAVHRWDPGIRRFL